MKRCVGRAGLWLTALLLILGLATEAAVLRPGVWEALPTVRAARLDGPLLQLGSAFAPQRPVFHAYGLLRPHPRRQTGEADTTEAADTVLLAVDSILQLPELPNGCEVTSLAMVLQSLGYPVTKMELAQSYMPQGWLYRYRGVYYAADPRYFYVGDPATAYGYYMLAPALAATANAYLGSHGGGCEAQDVSGADEQQLEALLAAGIPVIVWNTMDYGPAVYGEPWVLEGTGESYLPFLNLHCQVLVGMDAGFFYLHDPLTGGACPVERARFLAAYRQLGSQAVIVTRRSRINESVVLRSAGQ